VTVPARYPLTLRWPCSGPVVAIHREWRRLPEYRGVEARYRDEQELALCVALMRTIREVVHDEPRRKCPRLPTGRRGLFLFHP
jgi:hypothetical protein